MIFHGDTCDAYLEFAQKLVPARGGGFESLEGQLKS